MIDDPLPDGWRDDLHPLDHHWVSQALFQYKGNRVELKTANVQLKMYPPQAPLVYNQMPTIERYFARWLCVWMPKRLWKVSLKCPNPDCLERELTQAGLFPHVRRVLDVQDYYYLVTEYLECLSCKKKLIGWSKTVLDQLDIGHRYQFPAILTYRYACDREVITMLRQRTLGNSPSRLQHTIAEEHSENWLRKSILYLSACDVFKKASHSGLITTMDFKQPPMMEPTPKFRWFQSVYCLDVLSRKPESQAAITTTLGRVLKIDSTKKFAQMLGGLALHTAAWATNADFAKVEKKSRTFGPARSKHLPDQIQICRTEN